MGATIGQILSNAVGVTISPVPIIALILMLFSKAAAKNGLAFLAGWVKILIGVRFLFLAWKQWSGRPRPGAEPEPPKWIASIDGIAPPTSVLFGLSIVL